MIDVSISNMQSGLVSLLSQTMLSILSNLPKLVHVLLLLLLYGYAGIDKI